MSLDWKTAYAGMHESGETSYPPAALHYLLQICRQASGHIENHLLTPEQLVNEFRKRSQRDFGSMKTSVLEDWKLHTSEDLGKAVLLLAKHHCLTLEPSDTLEAFSSLGAQL